MSEVPLYYATKFSPKIAKGRLEFPAGQRRRAISYSYLRLIDSCITQLQAQGPSRTYNESKEEEQEEESASPPAESVSRFAFQV